MTTSTTGNKWHGLWESDRKYGSRFRTAGLRQFFFAASVVLGLIASMTSTSALAAPGWLDPVGLSVVEGNADNPRVAISGSGISVAAWQDASGATPVIRSAVRPAGGSWSAYDITAIGENFDAPNIAVSDDGTAVAIWRVADADLGTGGLQSAIQAVVKPPGESWGMPVTLSEPLATGEMQQRVPGITIDATGNAAAVWLVDADPNAGGFQGSVQAAYRPTGGADDGRDGWSSSANISDALGVDRLPKIAIDDNGNAVALWKRDPATIQTSDRLGSSWTVPTDLLTGAAGQLVKRTPRVAMDSTGNTVALWQLFDSVAGNSTIQSAYRPTGQQNWTIDGDISATGEDTDRPQVAIDDTGTAVALWRSLDIDGTGAIKSTTRAHGGTSWTDEVNVSPQGQNADYPRVAVDAFGNAVAFWTHPFQLAGGDDAIEVNSSVRAAEGTWRSPTTHATSVANTPGGAAVEPKTRVAASGNGNALAAWVVGQEGTPGPTIVQTASLGMDGPGLDGLRIPGEGTVGIPLSFSVAPLDIWGIGQTSWDFGDGDGASGATVTHTYSKAGRYRVQTSSTNAIGHASTATGTVTVSASATTPAPPTQSQLPAAPRSAPDPRRGKTSLSRISVRVRCLKGKKKGGKGKKATQRRKGRKGKQSTRLIKCRRNSKLRRRLMVSLTASGKAKVRLKVTQRLKRVRDKGAKRRTVTRTVLSRILKVRKGKHRYLVPIKRRYTTGRLKARIIVTGEGKKSKLVRVGK